MVNQVDADPNKMHPGEKIQEGQKKGASYFLRVTKARSKGSPKSHAASVGIKKIGNGSHDDETPQLKYVQKKAPKRLKESVEKYRQALIFSTSSKSLVSHEKNLATQLLRYRLQNTSEPDSFGSKHKNLLYQSWLVKSLEIPGVEVPMPQGLSTHMIEAFLRKEAPSIFTNLSALKKLYDTHLSTLEEQPFLKTKKAENLLKTIESEITEAFARTSKRDNCASIIGISQETEEWLHACRKKSSYLMVRSSGSEDTSCAANAGGNTSKVYIQPEAASLCRAIGDVIASYFSYGSLQNRINVGINPFKEELKIGVILQELIGEEIDGSSKTDDIPISVVLFSNEPLYVGSEQFRVMRMSASYGHGNGVVGGADAIACDTYLVLHSAHNPKKLYILSDIQPKTARMAPIKTAEHVELQRVKNPTDMVLRSTLDHEMLSRLFHWAVIAEQSLGKGNPLDMEIVVKSNVIYPVQARPVIRPALLPTYLDYRKVQGLAQNPIKTVKQAEMVVPGKGSVIVIHDQSEILVIDTLEQAESKFDKRAHKLVIVHTKEPANSHPVVNFSGMGIGCLYHSEKIDLLEEEYPLVVCMQSTTITSWDKTISPVESCISSGFTLHPAKIAVSLPITEALPSRIKARSQVPQEVTNLLLEIRSATTHAIALDRLQALKTHNWVTEIEKKITVLKRYDQVQVKPYLLVLKTLSEKVHAAFCELDALLQKKQCIRLQSLFHVKVIQTLLTGEATEANQYSIIDVLPITQRVEASIAYQKKLPFQPHLSTLLHAGRDTLPLAAVNRWTNFLLSLEPLIESKEISKETVLQFKQFVLALQDAQAFSLWMMLFFNTVVDSTAPKLFPKLFLEQNILKRYQGCILSLNELQLVSENISEIAQRLHQFSSPQHFQTAWQRLEKLRLVFTNGELFERFQVKSESTSPLVKVVFYKHMERVVDLFDMSIKTMKASQEFTDSEKFSYFTQMLTAYQSLSTCWTQDLLPSGSITILRSDLESYQNAIHSIMKKLMEKDWEVQSRPSKGFSVAGAKMGSGALFARHLPQTLEDVFTLIHQNLLVCLSSLNNSLFTDETLLQSLLPPKIQKAIQIMSQKMPPIKDEYERYERDVKTTSRVGIHVEESGEVAIRYNTSLRNHSASLEFCYNNETDLLAVKVALCGEARERWFGCKYILDALDATATLPLKEKMHIGRQEISFTWNLSDERSIEYAVQEYYEMASYSMRQGGYVMTDDFLYQFYSRSITRGVGNACVEHFAKYPTFEAERIFNRFLTKMLPQDTPQPIPLSILLHTHNSYKCIDEMLSAWAETPDMPCGEFIDKYQSSGRLQACDEAYIRRFLPSKDEPSHALMLPWVKSFIEHPCYHNEVSDLTLRNYIKNARDIHPLVAMVKAEIECSPSLSVWIQFMVQLVESGKGIETAEALVKKPSKILFISDLKNALMHQKAASTGSFREKSHQRKNKYGSYIEILNNIRGSTDAGIVKQSLHALLKKVDSRELYDEEVQVVAEICTQLFQHKAGFECISELVTTERPQSTEYLKLLVKLVGMHHGLDLALETVKQIVKKPPRDTWMRQLGFTLFADLLDHNRGKDLTEEGLSICQSLKDTKCFETLLSSMIRNHVPLSHELKKYVMDNPSIAFACSFATRGESLSWALEIAEKNFPRPNVQSSESLEELSLILALNKRGRAISIGQSVAKMFSDSPLIESKKIAIEIYQALVKQGYSVPEARKAAENGLFSHDRHIRKKYLELLRSL